jgi:hypothetical protein
MPQIAVVIVCVVVSTDRTIPITLVEACATGGPAKAAAAAHTGRRTRGRIARSSYGPDFPTIDHPSTATETGRRQVIW